MSDWNGGRHPARVPEHGGTDGPSANGVPRGPAPGEYPDAGDAEEPSLAGLLAILAQEWMLILILFASTVAAVALYTFTREPVYQTSSVVLVDTNTRRSGGGA